MTSRPAGVNGPVSRAGRFDLGIALLHTGFKSLV